MRHAGRRRQFSGAQGSACEAIAVLAVATIGEPGSVDGMCEQPHSRKICAEITALSNYFIGSILNFTWLPVQDMCVNSAKARGTIVLPKHLLSNTIYLF